MYYALKGSNYLLLKQVLGRVTDKLFLLQYQVKYLKQYLHRVIWHLQVGEYDTDKTAQFIQENVVILLSARF